MTGGYSLWMTSASELALDGDADRNGTVNGGDLNIVLENYNRTGMDWSHGDFNGDGTVNGGDLNAVLANYNKSLSVSGSSVVAAVPEPSGFWLAMTGLMGSLLWTWRKHTSVARGKWTAP